jgi:hypothetical protein
MDEVSQKLYCTLWQSENKWNKLFQNDNVADMEH